MTTVPALLPEDFPEVFTAIHGHAPYAWQRRLLDQVLAEGAWPAAIAAPTGTGKTAVLDVALFHLAFSASSRPRSASMRIVLAVDRCVIVDQAYVHARRILEALGRRDVQCSDALGRMSARLSFLSGGRPLHVAELRGGMPLESDWAPRPDQPTILCTTVDQLGSRLLFRGYGVNPGMASIHAGLLGTDALIILDEAHLSRAFEKTLSAIACHRSAQVDIGLPWGWTALTATSRIATIRDFRLTAEERSESAIERRLSAEKPVTLLQIGKEPQAVPFVDQAHRLLKELVLRGEPAPTIAIIVNRVALARTVLGLLEKDESSDAILLTGRVRPVERAHLLKTWQDRLEEGGNVNGRPLYVVATQCIEAGADFDFDAMVSQIAPLDALRQRFGRLARSGNRIGQPAPGSILAAASEVSVRSEDLVYGRALAAAWSWLTRNARGAEGKTLGSINFGPDALDLLLRQEPPEDECLSPSSDAPILRRPDLMAMTMTSPRPHPDPEPALFLHGDFRDDADVGIVWRGDLDASFRLAREGDAEGRESARQNMSSLLALLPPRAGEALWLPHWQVRRWLSTNAQDASASLADVPAPAPSEEAENKAPGRIVLRWRGPGECALVDSAEIVSGDVIVLPAEHGGNDDFGWAPDSNAPVRDVADLAAAPYCRRRAAFRLHPGLWVSSEDKPGWTDIREMLRAGTSAQVLTEACGLTFWSRAPGLALIHAYGDDPASGAVLLAPAGLPGSLECKADDPATEADEGSFGCGAVPLDCHGKAVARIVGGFANRLGLPDQLATTLERAALWHDAGKADLRFQAWLRGLAGMSDDGPVIAKTCRRADAGTDASARTLAGLPRRWRHEVASVRYAVIRLSAETHTVDPELVLWLIGTHHGHGRPFFNHDDSWDGLAQTLLNLAIPPAPGPDKLDFDWVGCDWTGMMQILQTRYGWWGIAFLEACLRLADHRASAGEEK